MALGWSGGHTSSSRAFSTFSAFMSLYFTQLYSDAEGGPWGGGRGFYQYRQQPSRTTWLIYPPSKKIAQHPQCCFFCIVFSLFFVCLFFMNDKGPLLLGRMELSTKPKNF